MINKWSSPEDSEANKKSSVKTLMKLSLNLWFSYVYRACKKGSLVENELNNGLLSPWHLMSLPSCLSFPF